MDWLQNTSLAPYIDRLIDWLVSSGIQIGLILILATAAVLAARKVIGAIFDGVGRRRSDDIDYSRRAATLKSVTRYILTILIGGIAAVMILGEFGVDIGPLLATAGVLGLAVGFGAKNLVEDMISGFFILLENQIRVGDVVEIAGHSGVVEKLNLRMTILRDLGGNVHFVRNGEIDIVTNKTKDYSRYLFDIGIAYKENVDEAMALMTEVDAELRKDADFGAVMLEPLEIMGLDRFADSAVIIRARNKTRPGQQWRVGREFKRRLKARFDREGIEIPFPHLTMFMGEAKDGGAAPLRLAGENGADAPDE